MADKMTKNNTNEITPEKVREFIETLNCELKTNVNVLENWKLAKEESHRLQTIIDRQREALSEIPNGAIHNGIALLTQLENNYGFVDVWYFKRPLAGCPAWLELKGCFQHLIEWTEALSLTAADHSEPVSNPDELSGWQPIETAPRDWSHVILYEPSDFDEEVFVGWFSDEDSGENCWMMGKSSKCHPTHWMPLPKPQLTIPRMCSIW